MGSLEEMQEPNWRQMKGKVLPKDGDVIKFHIESTHNQGNISLKIGDELEDNHFAIEKEKSNVQNAGCIFEWREL